MKLQNKRRVKYIASFSFIVVGAIIVAFAGNISAQTYPSGMVSYWKFDGSLTDELGIYNGTMGYYGSYAEGIINQGLHGAMGCSNPFAAKVDNFPNLDSFTIEAWIKPSCPPNSWQGSLTISKHHDMGSYNGVGYVLFTVPSPYGSSNYKFALQTFDMVNGQSIGQGMSSPLTYPCGSWSYVVLSRDRGNEFNLFVNGEEVASVLDNVVGSLANNEPLVFHGFTSGGCGWGMSAITMDEVAIYDRVLSEAEIQQHYQNGLKGLGYEIVVIPIPVLIDIKPGSFPNSINLKSKGNVPVAILSDSTFDATTVDRSTVLFADISPLSIGETPEDVNGDGLLDMVLHFKTQDLLNLQSGDTEACLAGKTLGGQEFKGCESIRIVK
ncbi:MAG: LamG domain-containing protein [bacterium]|nr:LamG domain-containing protein [Patescibacteria group bacterium]